MRLCDLRNCHAIVAPAGHEKLLPLIGWEASPLRLLFRETRNPSVEIGNKHEIQISPNTDALVKSRISLFLVV